MELHLLRSFLTVAREENFTRAARQLHLSQPALSRQIASLEQELGTPLFTRSSHHIELTDAGRLLKRRATELLALEQKTLQEFRTGQTLQGTITIGAGELRSVNVLAKAMAAFRLLYPDVCFSVYSANADLIKERIENGLLDLGLLSAPVEIGRYEFIQTGIDEKWVALVPEDHPLAEKTVLEPADLRPENLLFSDRDLVREMIVSWLGVPEEDLHYAAGGNLCYNMACMARAGMGIVLTVGLDCAYDGLKTIPLDMNDSTRSVLVWKKNAAGSRLIDTFIRYCRDMFEMHDAI